MPPVQAVQIAEQILTQEGYHPKDYRGEAVWKKGTGMMTSMQFVKLDVYDSALGIQAWVQSGIGDVGLPEQCLSGVIGVLPKQLVLGVLKKIQAAI